MKSIVKLDAALVPPPADFKGDFFKGGAVLVFSASRLLLRV